jgi:hypothetical protein
LSDNPFSSIDVRAAVAECENAPGPFAVKTLQEALQGDASRSIAYLVILSTYPDKRYFDALFHDVIRNGEDLGRFISACRSGVVRNGLGSSIKSRAQEWLKQVSAEEIYEHTAKHASGNAAWGWYDFLRLIHPKPETQYEQAKFEYMSRQNNPISAEAVRRAIGEDERMLSRDNERFLIRGNDDNIEDQIEELKRRLDELEAD